MKDDDSSSIVRSQTAHHVNVSEYTGNATTPQNHVTSDVDREIAISEADAGPAREIRTDAETRVDDTPHARLNTTATDASPADASDPLRIEADSAPPAPEQTFVPVDAFQDELAAIERARELDNRQRVPTTPARTDTPTGWSEPVPVDHHAALPNAIEAPHLATIPTESALSDHPVGEAKPSIGDIHALLPEPVEGLHQPELAGAELAHTHTSIESPPNEHHAAQHNAALSDAETPHLEAVPAEPVVSDHSIGEAKPVFSDPHALLPEPGAALHDPELDEAERGHAHPLSDPEPDPAPSHTPASLHSAAPHLHTPPHALSPTSAALADLNKDEFQGRLAGIKREVQALNERLTDFEAELDKDGMRPTRP